MHTTDIATAKNITSRFFILFAFLLGAFAGTVIWLFLKAVGLISGLLWDKLPEIIHFKGYAVLLCAAGGLIIGIFRKFFGDYPEELPVVMGKIKKDGHYDYSNMFVMLVAAFLPLVFAASIGPEAGLTGVIVGLCYWVGDNLKYAKTHEKEYSEIGEAVTLSVLFHAPLFGIFSVEEENGIITFFFDKDPTGIVEHLFIRKEENSIWTLDGRYAGTNTSILPKGIYIVNGKKTVIR